MDHTACVQWYQRGAEQGHVDCQFNLGAIFDEGTAKVTQSDSEAVRWYRLAAAQGDSTSLYNLGVLYATGRGVPQTPTRRCASTSAPRSRGTPGPRR
mmetsp:Transcript_1547/g.4666  ORF Transcript_1547/g.4666 Transcript_1547/m.4666 type:complete len:97 (+) Transcript_1547:625-915(+)